MSGVAVRQAVQLFRNEGSEDKISKSDVSFHQSLGLIPEVVQWKSLGEIFPKPV